jgi:DHA1 family tetracycline resistance protein-like MFS transporter
MDYEQKKVQMVTFSRRSFLALCFESFLVWMSYGFVYPLFAILIFQENSIFSDFTSSVSRGFWLGVLLTAGPLAQFFSSSVIGKISDRTGRKPVLLITTLIIAFGYLLSAYAIKVPHLFLLILGRLITGIGSGNIAVVNSSVADLSHPSTKARNFAWVAVFNGLGFAVGPALSGKISTWGLDIPFLFAGFLTVVSYFFVVFLFSETHEKKQKGYASPIFQIQHLFKITIRHKFFAFFCSFFIFCVGWSFYWEFIPVTWIKQYHTTVSQIGNFYACGSIFYVLTSGFLVQPIVRKFKEFPSLLFALTLLGFFLLPLVYAELWLYWICIPVQQFLVALIFPVATAIVSKQITEEQQGEVLGSFQAVQSLAFSLTPLLGGILINLSDKMPLVVSGVSMLLSSFILLVSCKKVLFR